MSVSSRRTVVKGAAWAAPVIAASTTIPAYAASHPCALETATWNMSSNGTSTTLNTASGTATAVSTFNGTVSNRGRGFNLYTQTAQAGNVYMVGSQWIALDQASAKGGTQTLTVTFPVPVYCVSFYIADIDTQYVSGSSRYRDQVQIPDATITAVPEAAGNVIINGNTAVTAYTATSATRDTYSLGNLGSARGTVQVSLPGGSNSFTIVYSNPNPGTGNGVNNSAQQVYISPIQYSTEACLCS